MTGRSMVRVALVIFVVLMVQQTSWWRCASAAPTPTSCWLLPITAALLGGPETGAIVGFLSGMAFDLVLPTPFGLSALVGACWAYATGSLTAAVDPRASWLKPVAALAGSVAADMLFAVLGAILGQQQMVQVDFLALFLVVGVSSLVPAPGRPVDAVGPRRREQPPLARPGPVRPAGPGEADTPPPDPRRPAPPQALDAPGAPPLLAHRRPPAAHAAAQERQRGLPRRLARGGPVAPEPAPAHRGDPVLLLFGVLVLRLWTLQVIEARPTPPP